MTCCSVVAVLALVGIAKKRFCHYAIWKILSQITKLYDWIEKFANLLAGSKTLFLIDDIIANETLDKQR